MSFILNINSYLLVTRISQLLREIYNSIFEFRHATRDTIQNGDQQHSPDDFLPCRVTNLIFLCLIRIK